MSPEEKRRHRNEVIDECVELVMKYDERAHKLATVRSVMGGGAQIPRSAQGMIALGLHSLKEMPPIVVTCKVISTKPVP